MRLLPRYIQADEGTRRDVSPGWWAVSADGTPVSGPYPTEEAAMVGIAKRGADQPTGRPGTGGPPPEE